MDETFAWTMAGGRRRHLTIAATAGDVVTNLSPGLGKRWIVLSGKLYLANNATVANRVLRLNKTNGTIEVEQIAASIIVAASASRTVNFGEVKAAWSSGSTTFANGGVGWGTSDYFAIDGIVIEGLDELRIAISAGVAGDSYEGTVTVLEMQV